MVSSLVIENLRGMIVGPVYLTVAAGTCATITGPSGAGKSLFLRMVADIVPNEGMVRLSRLDRAGMSAPAWRRQVVHVAAEPGWWAATAAAHVPPAALPEAVALAARLGLAAESLERPVASLSTGERQRFALVRALAYRPKALLLDEPTSALDATSVAAVEALLRETLAAGTILVLVSHDAMQAERLGGASYEMVAGRLTPT